MTWYTTVHHQGSGLVAKHSVKIFATVFHRGGGSGLLCGRGCEEIATIDQYLALSEKRHKIWPWLHEPGELSQWLCHDDSTINIVVLIIIIITWLQWTTDSHHGLALSEKRHKIWP